MITDLVNHDIYASSSARFFFLSRVLQTRVRRVDVDQQAIARANLDQTRLAVPRSLAHLLRRKMFDVRLTIPLCCAMIHFCVFAEGD